MTVESLRPAGAGAGATAPGVHQVILPPSGWSPVAWREIWQHRELLYFLAWRDIRSRYRQTLLGMAWAVLQPLATMAVFTFFFGRLAGLETKTGGTPYPLYVFAGLLPWTFFSGSTAKSGNALLANAPLLTKVYFPRLVLPLSALGVNLADLAVSLGVLGVLMVVYGAAPGPHLALLPLFLVALLLLTAGLGALVAAVTVTYRDLQVVVPFCLQLWLFATPVIYPPTLVPADRGWILLLNPMAGIVQGFRAAFLGTPLDWTHPAASLLLSGLIFGLGAACFARMERSFADLI